MVGVPDQGLDARRRGGVKVVRDGVWRVDVELPRVDGEPRRRVSRTVVGTIEDAERALDELCRQVAAASVKRGRRAGAAVARSARPRNSGAVSSLAPDRWLVGVEGPADPVSGKRRRYRRVVRGGRDEAEVALARLKLTVDGGEVPTGTHARTVRAACDLYLSEMRTELQTQRTDRSACRRICVTVLPGGQLFGVRVLAKVDWRLVEQVFAKWSDTLQPPTQARYASTLAKVLEHAKRSGWCRANPVVGARRPKVPSRRPDVPATVEVREALRIAQSRDFTMYAYVVGMATIGSRRSELLAITVVDVDLRDAVVTIRASIADGGPGTKTYRKATKRDDWRDVPLTEQMVEVFAELFERRRTALAPFGRTELDPDGYVFSDDPNGATWLRPDTTTQRWLRARGDSKVTFAMLRRYVATQLFDVTNGDYRTVASITGNREETLRRWYDAGPNLDHQE